MGIYHDFGVYLLHHDTVVCQLLGMSGVLITAAISLFTVLDARRARTESKKIVKDKDAEIEQVKDISSKVFRDALGKDALNRALLAAANVGIIVSDDTGRVVEWNDTACAMFGWTEHEVLGRDVAVIVPPAQQAAHAAGLARYNKTGEGAMLGRTAYFDALHKDGHTFKVSISLSGFELPEQGRFACALITPIPHNRRQRRKADVDTQSDMGTHSTGGGSDGNN